QGSRGSCSALKVSRLYSAGAPKPSGQAGCGPSALRRRMTRSSNCCCRERSTSTSTFQAVPAKYCVSAIPKIRRHAIATAVSPVAFDPASPSPLSYRLVASRVPCGPPPCPPPLKRRRRLLPQDFSSTFGSWPSPLPPVIFSAKDLHGTILESIS